MAKLYQEVNKVGFNPDILSKAEKEVFNEIVSELANGSDTEVQS